MCNARTSLNLALLLIAMLVLSSLAACGGGAASSGLDLTSSSDQTSVDTKDTRALEIGSALPSLPSNLKPSTETRTSSEATQLDFTGSGDALLQYAGGVVDGDNLVLTSTEENVAWALYEADGLLGLRVTQFSSVAQPGTEETYYGIGLSNFSFGRWQWQQYTNQSEVVFDLMDNHHRLTNMSGHLYWVIAVPAGGFTVTVNSASIAVDGQDTWLPGGGNYIFASQGLPGYIELQWGTMDDATSYELYRREASGPPGRPGDGEDNGAEFELLATLEAVSYEDTAVTPNVWYEYKVCAVNENGEGGFSGIAFGLAREADAAGAVVNACGKIIEITADAVTLELMRDGMTQTWDLTAETQYLTVDGETVDVSYFQPEMFVHISGTSEDPAGLYPVASVIAELGTDGLPPLHEGHHNSSFGTITEYDADHIQITTDGYFINTYNYAIVEDTEYLNEQGEAVTFEYFSVGMRAFVRGAVDSEGNLFAQAICAEREMGDGEQQPGDPPQDPQEPPHEPGQPAVIGVIDSISETALSVTDSEGTAFTFVINEQTMWVDVNGQPLNYTDFVVGESVLVLSIETEEGLVAMLVHKNPEGGNAP